MTTALRPRPTPQAPAMPAVLFLEPEYADALPYDPDDDPDDDDPDQT